MKFSIGSRRNRFSWKSTFLTNKFQVATYDLTKSMSGCLEMVDCEVIRGAEVQFSIRNQYDLYTLTAKTTEEMKEWTRALFKSAALAAEVFISLF